MNELTSRELNLLVAFPIFIVVASILGLLILRRDPKYRGNQFFALSFWFNAAALVFNLVYLFVKNHQFIIILNICSISCINTGLILILIAILILYKGENVVMENKLTYVFLFTMIIIMLIHGFLGFFLGGVDVIEITLPGATAPSLVPHWYLYFGLYELILTQTLFLTLLYFSIMLFREISAEMRRKFIRFMIGGFFINLTLISVVIQNMRIIEGYELIGGVLNLGAFIGVILIYYGIVRR